MDGIELTEAVSWRKARLYEQYRIPYSAELVPTLLERVGQVQVAADIGAGTGQLARLLAPVCTRVVAVEPDDSMRQVSREALAPWHNVQMIGGLAEATGLGADSVDMIVVGNAFHRFQAPAMDELRRILKPNGWAATVGYRMTQAPYAEALFRRLAELAQLSTRIRRRWHHLPSEALFGSGETELVDCSEQTIQEDWKAFFGAACAGIEAPEPGDPEFARFQAINREAFDAHAQDGLMQISCKTTVCCGRPQP
jgi:SAM-dependent methyltransferase